VRLSAKHSLAMIIAMTMILATALIFWARWQEDPSHTLVPRSHAQERSALETH